MATTTTKARTESGFAQDNSARQQVAVIAPPRLQYVKEARVFNVDESKWRALCESVFPTATSSRSIILALDYCRARKLDPMKRVVHIVPIWDRNANGGEGGYVDTIWPGIAEHRTTASRTRTYAGLDAPRFGPMVKLKFEGRVRDYKNRGAWLPDVWEGTVPEWCEMTVYRFVQGERVPFPGPRCYWQEFYTRKGRESACPNDQWQKRPSGMIEKCAEAGALRRAFPEELGDEGTVEEVGFFGAESAREVAADVEFGEPEPKPERTKPEPKTEKAEKAEKAAEVTTGKATDTVETKPEPQAQATAEASWAVPEGIVGQDPKLSWIKDRLALAKTDADVSALFGANADFLNKLGSNLKSTVFHTFDARRAELKAAANG